MSSLRAWDKAGMLSSKNAVSVNGWGFVCNHAPSCGGEEIGVKYILTV